LIKICTPALRKISAIPTEKQLAKI